MDLRGRAGAAASRPVRTLLAVVVAGGLAAGCGSAPPSGSAPSSAPASAAPASAAPASAAPASAAPAAPSPAPAAAPSAGGAPRFADTGRNPFFVLEPGYQQTYTGGDGRLVITVLNQTEPVDGITTRVIEERETRGDTLVELARNFYAIEPATQDVYYFGEEVDEYSDGKVSHPGVWRSGRDGAHFGLFMPARPAVGFQHDQERAPGVAEDHAEIVSTTETVTGPSGPVTNCIRVKETSRLEPGTTEYKLYAPGVGLITDQDLTLVGYRR